MSASVINYFSGFKWLEKIDIDEFLFPLYPSEKIIEVFTLLYSYRIKDMDFCSSFFGPFWQEKSSSTPFIERFIKRYSRYNRCWKVEEYLAKIEYHSSGHKAGKENAEKWPEADRAASLEDDKQIFRFLSKLKEVLS